jgi:hypothetical protein
VTMMFLIMEMMTCERCSTISASKRKSQPLNAFMPKNNTVKNMMTSCIYYLKCTKREWAIHKWRTFTVEITWVGAYDRV